MPIYWKLALNTTWTGFSFLKWSSEILFTRKTFFEICLLGMLCFKISFCFLLTMAQYVSQCVSLSVKAKQCFNHKFQRSKTKERKGKHLSLEGDFSKQNSQRLVIKYFPKSKGFVILRDNLYLLIAVGKLLARQSEIFSSLKTLSHPKIWAEKIFQFWQISQNLFS